MEPVERTTQKPKRKGVFIGIAILILGVVLLLDAMGVNFPRWMFEWYMFLIAIGFIIGLNTKFKKPIAYVLMIVGGAFLVEDLNIIPISLISYFWPVVLIFIGLVVIFRPRTPKRWEECNSKDKDRWKEHKESWKKKEFTTDSSNELELTCIFNGTQRKIISKNFKGGSLETIFGGAEIDFTHADFEGEVVLDVSIVFGGLKLIVPPNWQVNTKMTSILAGVDDKRNNIVEVIADDKVLTIDGAVIFGGIEIQSY